ncbi:hypothetical protein CYMTET_8999 [Cymbomonas tetramitiformis]|uniref:Uncharacterized protein n=1 Tax=Cymbomonas tetramitiformis TaxID=36881 RepID=A0AAE0GTP4_9CHLO|nr:hypothetical protein CYMTET_8999 [Cymbomonas tetramitiformis]
MAPRKALEEILPYLIAIGTLAECIPQDKWPLPPECNAEVAELEGMLTHVTKIWTSTSTREGGTADQEKAQSGRAADGKGSLDRLHRGNRQHWLGPLDNLFSRHPEKIAPTLSEFVSKQSPDVQRDVVQELCGTNAGFGMLLIENVKEGFTWLARSASKLHVNMRMATAAMICGENFRAHGFSVTSSAELLGVHRRVVESALRGREALSSGCTVGLQPDENSVPDLVRGTRNTSESKEQVQNLVREYWLSNTRVSPCKKDVVLARDSAGKLLQPNQFVSKQWLESSQVSLFMRFQARHPEIKMKQRTFEGLKPKNVVRLRRQDNITCTCRYHEDFRMVLEGFNRTRETLHSGCACKEECWPRIPWSTDSTRKVIEGTEEVCDIVKVGTSTSQFAESLLCPRPGDSHRIECLKGECPDCGGLANLQLCATELASQRLVEWKCYENLATGHVTDDGEAVKRLQFVHKRTPVGELVYKLQQLLLGHEPGKSKNCECRGSFVHNTAVEGNPGTWAIRELDGSGTCPFLRPYAYHTFMALHQHRHYRQCVDNLPLGHCCVVFDFSENHKLTIPRAAQSMHWVLKQATILVCVLWRHASLEVDGVESTSENPVIIKDYLYFLSDDRVHDHHFVRYMRKTIIEDYFVGRGLAKPVFLHEWVDGSGCQNKCAAGFADVGKSKAEWYLGVPCQRNFFETAHAKGEQDAAGAHVKHAAATAVISEGDEFYANINCAPDLHRFCVARLSRPAPTTYMKSKVTFNARHFYLVPESPLHEEPGGMRAVDRTGEAYQSVDGTLRMHSVRAGVGEGRLLFRDRSCYCAHCYAQCTHPVPDSSRCLEKSHVDSWREVELRAASGAEARQVRMMVERYATEVSLEVRRGSVFAVRVEGDAAHSYYLVKALASSMQVDCEMQEDDYGVTHGPGSWVISGRYFEWKDEGERDAYVLDTSKKCLIPCEAVIATEVPLIRQGAEYFISDRTHQRLLALV